MKYLSNRLAFVLTTLVVLSAVSVAVAQRPGGGRGGFGGGGFGGPTVSVLLRDSNAEELKLTDDQKTKIREISDKLREDTRGRDLFTKLRSDSPEEERTAVMAESAKISEEQRLQSDGEIKKVLSAEQFTRYRQMVLQQRGASALAGSDVATDLKLTDDQVAKLKAIGEESTKKTRELMQGFGRGGGEDMRAKFDELRKETDEKRLAILTDTQRQQWTTLKGPEPAAEGDAAKTDTKISSTTAADAKPVRRSQPVVDSEAVTSQIGDKPRKPVVSFGK